MSLGDVKRLSVGVLCVLLVCLVGGSGCSHPRGEAVVAGQDSVKGGHPECVAVDSAALHEDSVPAASIQDVTARIDTLWNRADRAHEALRFREALQELDELGELLLAKGDSTDLVKYFAWRGDTYYSLGETTNALRAFRTALTFRTNNPQWELFSAYVNSGVIYGEFRYDAEALKNFQKADSVLRVRGNSNGRSYLRFNMSDIYLRDGHYEEALYACYDAQLSLRKRYVDLVALIHVQMARVYAKMGRTDLVKAHSDFVLNYVATRGSDRLWQEVYVKMASAWQDCGDDEQTESLLMTERALHVSNPSELVYRLLIKTTAKQLERTGDYAGAERVVDGYLRYDDSTRRLLAQVDFAEVATADAIFLMHAEQQRQLEQLEQERLARRGVYRWVALFMAGLFTLLVAIGLTMQAVREQRIQALISIRAVADRLAVVNASVEHRQMQLVQQQEEIEQQRVMLEQTQRMLRHVGKELRGDLRYVSNLQQTLLPSEEKLRSTLGETFVLYLPRDVVSGDFYSCAEVGDAKVLAVFDCAGHGIAGALMSIIGNILMRTVLQEESNPDPAIILTKLHRLVQQYLHDNRDSLVSFYTMDVSVAVWHARERRLVLSSACRTAYLYTEGQLHAYRGVLMSIGSTLVHRTYVNDEIVLSAPATLYLCSDGYADQLDKSNRKYGRVHFEKLLSNGAGHSMQQQLSVLRREFDSYRVGALQTDDVCVLGVRLGEGWA